MEEIIKLIMENSSYAEDAIKILHDCKDEKEKDTKHLKGYIYDSLCYRYIHAREKMADYEYFISSREHDINWYHKQAERDCMRFIQILNEVIGEHD